MADPWAEFSDAPADPWAEFADAPTPGSKRKGRGIGRKVDAAVRGAADMLSFGFADEIAAAGDALPALAPGGETFGDAYTRNVEEQRAIDAADRTDVPVSRGTGQVAGFVGGLAAGAIAQPARLLPNALRGGGSIGAVARATGAGAASAGLAAAGNTSGDLGTRGDAAVPAAILGGAVGALSVPVASLIGRGVNALANRASPPIQRAANALRPRVDPAVARERINALRDAGAEPSFASGLDDAGRGFVASAAKRQTPARETVQRRANAARVDLPNRINRQAQRLSADPRNPRQIAEDLGAARAAQGDLEFGAVRGDRVPLSDDAVQALRTRDGRAAIRDGAEAALRSLDPQERAVGAELNRLADEVLDNPGGVEITVGQSQAISEALFDAADAAARNGRNREAASLGNLARAIRGNARTQVSGYDAALRNFEAQSNLMEAAETGEDFLLRNTDEFLATTPGPGQPGNELARATARRAVERRAGESPSGAISTAESIGIAPEQMARTRAILPEDEAQALERGMNAELQVYRELQQVAPRTGPWTNLNQQDEAASGILTDTARGAIAGQGVRGAFVGAVFSRLRTLGLSNADAQAVADIATDPRMVDQLILRIERINGPGSADFIRQAITDAATRNAGELAAP